MKLTPAQKKWTLAVATFFATGAMEAWRDGLTAHTAPLVIAKSAAFAGILRALGWILAATPTHRPDDSTRNLS